MQLGGILYGLMIGGRQCHSKGVGTNVGIGGLSCISVVCCGVSALVWICPVDMTSLRRTRLGENRIV